MSEFTCLIQASSAAAAATEELEQRLRSHHEAHYPGEAASVTWRTADAGWMFTEGRPSTSAVISCTVLHATTRDERETYMRGVCDIWTEVTGCTDHEVVVSLTDASAADDSAARA